MQRQLFQTVRTLSIAVGLLMIGLILTNPDTIAASSAGPDAVMASSAEHAGQDLGRDNKSRASHRRAKSKDAMVLPFFSFAQGLRRNNRS